MVTCVWWEEVAEFCEYFEYRSSWEQIYGKVRRTQVYLYVGSWKNWGDKMCDFTKTSMTLQSKQPWFGASLTRGQRTAVHGTWSLGPVCLKNAGLMGDVG